MDVEDSEALAQRLVQVLTLDEPAWRSMSDAAFAAVADYTWDDATTLFEAALVKAAASPNGPARAATPAPRVVADDGDNVDNVKMTAG